MDGMHELASGVDALYLSGRAPLPEALLLRLATARALAESRRPASAPYEADRRRSRHVGCLPARELCGDDRCGDRVRPRLGS